MGTVFPSLISFPTAPSVGSLQSQALQPAWTDRALPPASVNTATDPVSTTLLLSALAVPAGLWLKSKIGNWLGTQQIEKLTGTSHAGVTPQAWMRKIVDQWPTLSSETQRILEPQVHSRLMQISSKTVLERLEATDRNAMIAEAQRRCQAAEVLSEFLPHMDRKRLEKTLDRIMNIAVEYSSTNLYYAYGKVNPVPTFEKTARFLIDRNIEGAQDIIDFMDRFSNQSGLLLAKEMGEAAERLRQYMASRSYRG